MGNPLDDMPRHRKVSEAARKRRIRRARLKSRLSDALYEASRERWEEGRLTRADIAAALAEMAARELERVR